MNRVCAARAMSVVSEQRAAKRAFSSCQVHKDGFRGLRDLRRVLRETGVSVGENKQIG